MNLNDVTIGYSLASGNILLLGDRLDECKAINQDFWDTLEQVMHGKQELKFNVRGKFFKVRMEECQQ